MQIQGKSSEFPLPLLGCFYQSQPASLGLSLTKLLELPTSSEILSLQALIQTISMVEKRGH